MKFFGKPAHISISFGENGIEFGYFEKKKESFELKDYQYKDFNSFEIFDLNILDLTSVKLFINKFLIANKISKSLVYLCLPQSKRINESIVTSKKLTNNIQELDFVEEGKFVWGFDYLGFDEVYYYYVVGIPQEVLFQYKLLFFDLPGLLVKVTTDNLALLNCCKILGNNIFDLNNVNIQNLYAKASALKNERIVLSSYVQASKNFLSISLGMFI